MNRYTQIAVRFEDRTHTPTGSVPLNHRYRSRWWLPIIGPTASCLLDHIGQDPHDEWRTLCIGELATALGVGYRKSNSQLTRALERLTLFGFAKFDVPPGDPNSPICITFFKTVQSVPHHHSSKWPPMVQAKHHEALRSLTPS